MWIPQLLRWHFWSVHCTVFHRMGTTMEFRQHSQDIFVYVLCVLCEAPAAWFWLLANEIIRVLTNSNTHTEYYLPHARINVVCNLFAEAIIHILANLLEADSDGFVRMLNVINIRRNERSIGSGKDWKRLPWLSWNMLSLSHAFLGWFKKLGGETSWIHIEKYVQYELEHSINLQSTAQWAHKKWKPYRRKRQGYTIKQINLASNFNIDQVSVWYASKHCRISVEGAQVGELHMLRRTEIGKCQRKGDGLNERGRSYAFYFT